jgi:uncharacterized membrane protein
MRSPIYLLCFVALVAFFATGAGHAAVKHGLDQVSMYSQHPVRQRHHQATENLRVHHADLRV